MSSEFDIGEGTFKNYIRLSTESCRMKLLEHIMNDCIFHYAKCQNYTSCATLPFESFKILLGTRNNDYNFHFILSSFLVDINKGLKKPSVNFHG